jgi:hypothetical protein
MNRLINLAGVTCSQTEQGFEACYRSFAREFLAYVFEHSSLSALIMREAHKQGKQTALKARFPELIDALSAPLPPSFVLSDGSVAESRQIAYIFLTIVFSSYQLSLSDSAAGCAVRPPDTLGSLPDDDEERIRMLMGIIDLTFFRGVLSAEGVQ